MIRSSSKAALPAFLLLILSLTLAVAAMFVSLGGYNIIVQIYPMFLTIVRPYATAALVVFAILLLPTDRKGGVLQRILAFLWAGLLVLGNLVHVLYMLLPGSKGISTLFQLFSLPGSGLLRFMFLQLQAILRGTFHANTFLSLFAHLFAFSACVLCTVGACRRLPANAETPLYKQ